MTIEEIEPDEVYSFPVHDCVGEPESTPVALPYWSKVYAAPEGSAAIRPPSAVAIWGW
jgi:hypothetical protein